MSAQDSPWPKSRPRNSTSKCARRRRIYSRPRPLSISPTIAGWAPPSARAAGASLDEIVGVLHVRDLFSALNEQGFANVRIEGLLRDAYIVPETQDLAALLADFRRESFHMAVVVDEYGTMAGIVTLEDLVEELVGVHVQKHAELLDGTGIAEAPHTVVPAAAAALHAQELEQLAVELGRRAGDDCI